MGRKYSAFSQINKLHSCKITEKPKSSQDTKSWVLVNENLGKKKTFFEVNFEYLCLIFIFIPQKIFKNCKNCISNRRKSRFGQRYGVGIGKKRLRCHFDL